MRYLLTQDGITVVIQGRPYSISSHQPGFAEVRDAVQGGRDPVHVLGLIQAKATLVRGMIEQSLRRQNLGGSLTYEEGVIFYNGAPLYNYAAETLCRLLNLGHDVGALAAFIDKQQRNPDPMIHEELYKFLEFGKIPLTPDGDFLAYKAVRADYKDIHSGTFDNSVGAKPRLSGGRAVVDPDRNRTCSSGLHVCSYGYLPHFAHAQGHVMICKVDPQDVVAIPADYNNTKMRVVGYEVAGEVTSYYQRGEDVLAQERLADRRYEVHYAEEGCGQVGDAFFTVEEAVAEARAIRATEGVESAVVVDTKKGGEVVFAI